jgi:hypothetical protein
MGLTEEEVGELCDTLRTMRTRTALLWMLLWTVPVLAQEYKTFTHDYFLYSVDYPETWRIKQVGSVTAVLSPHESKEDKFAENVEIVAEDLSKIPGGVTLFDYYRKAVGGAQHMLPGFKLLEEAQTVWRENPAVVNLYTMSDKGEVFKRKAYTFMSGETAYVLTYTARRAEFDEYLPAAERIMASIRVSP